MELFFRPVTSAQLSWLMTQRNKPELMKYFRQNEPLVYRNQVDWYNEVKRKKGKIFIVYDNDGAIGYGSLHPIDLRHKHAEFGLFVVPGYQERGYATQILKELLRIGFEEMGLHKIYSDVLDYPGENRFKFYQDRGFSAEGTQKEHYFKDGKWLNSIMFAMTENEYKNNKNRLEIGRAKEPVRQSSLR